MRSGCGFDFLFSRCLQRGALIEEFNFLGISDILMMFDGGFVLFCAAPLNIIVATFTANEASRRADAES